MKRNIKYIVLHCSAGPQTQTIEVIKNWWKSLGWDKPGYHHIIEADGTVHDLLPISEVANGVAGYNSNSIHICYVGGVEVKKGVNAKGQVINVLGKAVDNRTDAQKSKQIELLKKYKKQFPNAVIKGHRDFSPDKNRDGIIQPSEWMKTCPSFSVKEWLACVGL